MYHDAMDMGILKVTLALEIAILGGLFYRHWMIRLLPCFTLLIVFSALEVIPLTRICLRGTPHEYYLAYYAFDLLNIFLYLLAMRECWQRGYFTTISVTVAVYLSLKALSYAMIVVGRRDAALAIHGDLRFVNLACYAMWCCMIWGYDRFGTQSRTR